MVKYVSIEPNRFFIVMFVYMVRWPSGLRRPLGKRVYGNVPRVRIPLSPPYINQFLAIMSLVEIDFVTKTLAHKR